MESELNTLRADKIALETKIKELTEQLKKYTNGKRHIRYYEKHTDVVKERAKAYMERMKEEHPEKLQEWRKTAYENRKLKLKQQQDS